jgi:hypothetical protein
MAHSGHTRPDHVRTVYDENFGRQRDRKQLWLAAEALAAVHGKHLADLGAARRVDCFRGFRHGVRSRWLAVDRNRIPAGRLSKSYLALISFATHRLCARPLAARAMDHDLAIGRVVALREK